MRQCCNNDFEVMMLDGDLGLFMMVTGRESSSPWACPESHASVYYHAGMKTKPASTLYMKRVIVLPVSVLVGDEYL